MEKVLIDFELKKPEHCKYYLPIVVGRKEIYFLRPGSYTLIPGF